MLAHAKVLPRFTFRARSLHADLHRSRLRERYLEIRLPDYLALRRRQAPVAEVVALAQALHEAGDGRVGAEVLTVALQDDPSAKALWLALGELYYLAAEGHGLAALIEAFKTQFPDAPEVLELARLGARVAPHSAPFVGVACTRGETLPGWLTGSAEGDGMAAADLHALLENAGPGGIG